jgi:hypothetical protein
MTEPQDGDFARQQKIGPGLQTQFESSMIKTIKNRLISPIMPIGIQSQREIKRPHLSQNDKKRSWRQ